MTLAVAVLALPTGAAASPELGETSNGVFSKLAVGSKIQATSLGTSKLTSPGGTTLVECSSASMTGDLYENSGTSIKGNITSAAFTNAGGADCTALFGGTAKVTTNVGSGIPWCIQTTKTADQIEVRGGKCSEAARSITFVLDTSSFGECKYVSTTFPTGTFTTDTSGQSATVKLTKAGLWKLEEGAFCPAEANLDIEYLLETDGTNTPLYIR
jgi:hypothetical protein